MKIQFHLLFSLLVLSVLTQSEDLKANITNDTQQILENETVNTEQKEEKIEDSVQEKGIESEFDAIFKVLEAREKQQNQTSESLEGQDEAKQTHTFSEEDMKSLADLEAALKEMSQSMTLDDVLKMPDLYGFADDQPPLQEEGFEKQTLSEPIQFDTNDDFPDIPDILSEWPEMMQNFQPDDLIAFDIQAGEIETLYQEIATPTTIRGAFFIPFYPITNKIDFQIKTLDNLVVYAKEGVQDHIFSIDIKNPGEYKLVFSNKRGQDAIQVNFAIDVHDYGEEHLQRKDLDPFTIRLERLNNAMRDNYIETKFTQQRQEQGLSVLVSTHNKLLLFTIFETLGIMGINIWQIYYIKRILENKRLI